MLPFSKRPPGPQEYLLGSGDYEAVRSPVPPPPRAPVFARSAAAPAAYGHDAYAHAYAQHQHGSYRSYGPYDPRQDPRMMAAPAPPNSLAPVAM